MRPEPRVQGKAHPSIVAPGASSEAAYRRAALYDAAWAFFGGVGVGSVLSALLLVSLYWLA